MESSNETVQNAWEISRKQRWFYCRVQSWKKRTERKTSKKIVDPKVRKFRFFLVTFAIVFFAMILPIALMMLRLIPKEFSGVLGAVFMNALLFLVTWWAAFVGTGGACPGRFVADAFCLFFVPDDGPRQVVGWNRVRDIQNDRGDLVFKTDESDLRIPTGFWVRRGTLATNVNTADLIPFLGQLVRYAARYRLDTEPIGRVRNDMVARTSGGRGVFFGWMLVLNILPFAATVVVMKTLGAVMQADVQLALRVLCTAGIGMFVWFLVSILVASRLTRRSNRRRVQSLIRFFTGEERPALVGITELPDLLDRERFVAVLRAQKERRFRFVECVNTGPRELTARLRFLIHLMTNLPLLALAPLMSALPIGLAFGAIFSDSNNVQEASGMVFFAFLAILGGLAAVWFVSRIESPHVFGALARGRAFSARTTGRTYLFAAKPETVLLHRDGSDEYDSQPRTQVRLFYAREFSPCGIKDGHATIFESVDDEKTLYRRDILYNDASRALRFVEGTRMLDIEPERIGSVYFWAKLAAVCWSVALILNVVAAIALCVRL